jgi:hypothetical protein
MQEKRAGWVRIVLTHDVGNIHILITAIRRYQPVQEKRGSKDEMVLVTTAEMQELNSETECSLGSLLTTLKYCTRS